MLRTRSAMAEIFDARTKQLRLAEQRKTEAELEATISRLDAAIRAEGEDTPGCGSRFFCGLLGGRPVSYTHLRAHETR